MSNKSHGLSLTFLSKPSGSASNWRGRCSAAIYAKHHLLQQQVGVSHPSVDNEVREIFTLQRGHSDGVEVAHRLLRHLHQEGLIGQALDEKPDVVPKRDHLREEVGRIILYADCATSIHKQYRISWFAAPSLRTFESCCSQCPTCRCLEHLLLLTP